MRRSWLSLLVLCGCAGQPSGSSSVEPEIDFRYAPFHWETAIGLPHDWLKTTVNQDAALTYDYAPGPYATPLTRVHLGVAGKALSAKEIAWSKETYGAVDATLQGAAQEVRLTLLRLVDSDAAAVPTQGFRRREVIYNHALGWAKPPDGTDPAFTSVAWSANNQIVYELQVPRGATRTVALGWADSRYHQPKLRVMRGLVEGADMVEVDPTAEAGNNGPVVRQVTATDTNRDGWIRVEVVPSPNGVDPNSFLSGIWMFPAGGSVTDADIISGVARGQAELVVDCGNDLHPTQAGITDLMVGRFPEGAVPEVRIETGRELVWDEGLGALMLGGRPMVTTIPKATGFRQVEGGYVLEMPDVREAVVSVHHGHQPATLASVEALPQAYQALDAYWADFHRKHPLVYSVPNEKLQGVLQASWDNYYRIADIVEGHNYFQTGPSVYRHVWSGDATIFLQNGLFGGDTAGVRDYMGAVERYLQPNGQHRVLMPHTLQRETPQYVMQLLYFGELTGNDSWLLNRWDQVRGGMDFIFGLRERTLAHPDSAYHGLFPPGFADGGIAGVNAEYSTVYYTYVAMRHLERAVQRLGIDEPSMGRWRKAEADMLESFRVAAKRDMRKDEYGNIFLPMKVGSKEEKPSSTLAQWGMLEATNYGEWFKPGDSLALGTLATLLAHSEQGLAVGTGWIPDGVWPWFSSIQAMSHIQVDQPQEAIDLLYAITNHMSPLGTEVEEQLPRHVGERTGGDQSNASGSAYYVVQVRRMLVNERSDGLHLLPAAPEYWFDAGEKIEVNGTLTGYGPLTLTTEVSPDGQTATVRWNLALRNENWVPTLKLHTRALERAGFEVTVPATLGLSGEVVAHRKP